MEINETLNKIQNLPKSLSKGLTGKRKEVFIAAQRGEIEV